MKPCHAQPTLLLFSALFLLVACGDLSLGPDSGSTSAADTGPEGGDTATPDTVMPDANTTSSSGFDTFSSSGSDTGVGPDSFRDADNNNDTSIVNATGYVLTATGFSGAGGWMIPVGGGDPGNPSYLLLSALQPMTPASEALTGRGDVSSFTLHTGYFVP